MTTIQIDDGLSQEAARAAAAQGKSLEEFASDALRQAVTGAVVRWTTRNGLPVIDSIPPAVIDPEAISVLLQEEGF